jgi:hypothetical protein
MMTTCLNPGCRVRRRHDNGWSEPGVLTRIEGEIGNVYWPEDDRNEPVPLSDLEEYKTAA